MYVDGNNLKLDANELVGTYTTPERDVGYIATFSIAIEAIATISSSLAFSTEETRKFSSSASMRFTGEELAGALDFEIRYSEDDISWTAWQEFRRGDYYCRYFQLRMIVSRSGLGINLLVSTFNYSVDLPDVNEKGGHEVTVAASGKAVVFDKIFHQEPIVNVTIIDGDGIYYRHSSKDSTGFTVKLYEADGTAATGNFEWHAYGV